MKTRSTGPHQAGQSMTEFLVALIVLLPLFLAVSYAGRYGDILITATQASRYAGFQRVMQPSAAVLPDSKIEDQMRARFFVRGNALHGGAIQSDDTAGSLGAGAQQALWKDMGGNPLLKKTTDATLTFGSTDLSNKIITTGITPMRIATDKQWTGASVANVEVSLVDQFDLQKALPGPLRIAATTATAPDGFGSGGSSRTVASSNPGTVVNNKLLKPLLGPVSTVVDLVIDIFEPCSPDIGYNAVDVVPNAHHLSTPAPVVHPCH
jgi:hypothetical protein